MCLIVLAWQAHPDYPLLVAANRDEFFARPSAAAAFWDDAPAVFGGRDLQAGGSWLGITRPQSIDSASLLAPADCGADTARASRAGKSQQTAWRQGFAALTNFRELAAPPAAAPSRGRLVADYLRAFARGDESGKCSADGYLAALAPQLAGYGACNLLVGDGQRLGYCSKRGGATRWLAPGIYGISNHLLDTPWPKLATAKAAFAAALPALPALDPFFALLRDEKIVADEHLPETGVSREWERRLSAIFVRSPAYGTRASTLIAVGRDGTTRFVERSFGPGAEIIGEVDTVFGV
ncbi:NRDE family protein [Rhodocyclus tenuis]|uniref:Uncharacterized protein with NRDE domain n=1 Tax=Rhodocyclus tenuis TaxID=1066 RepID=A0A840G1K0_RHOTE|nr:NRDE family protein [Rhodocyclus tenuis]MBB4248277.1 uncharacterized protein with NRDE domain [Rhodocyclus tenuis]